MKESDIRPAELMDKLSLLLAKDRELWLSRKEEFICAECPACSSYHVSEKINLRGMDFTTCSDCGTVYYNPRPTEEILAYYYQHAESYNYWADYVFPATEVNRRENIVKPKVELIENYFADKNAAEYNFLEIGAGFGIFSEEIKKRKIFNTVTAVEPTPGLANRCREKGLDVIESPFENAGITEASFQCIASFEVIEHVFSPIDFLRNCNRILSDKGYLILTCPNIAGFDFKILGKENSSNFGLEHINMFNPHSLELLLTRAGFRSVEITTPGKLDADIVRNKALKNPELLSNERFLKEILITNWETLGKPFQKFLSENKLSSNMMAIARK